MSIPLRKRTLLGLLLVLGLLISTRAAHADRAYSTLVFLPLGSSSSCSGSSSGSSGCSGSSISGTVLSNAESISDMWVEETGLADGGFLEAADFGTADFLPGFVYIIDTNVVPAPGNRYAPANQATAAYSIYAHWLVVQSWVEKAALDPDIDNLVIAGHSASGPGVVWAASAVNAEVSKILKGVITVAAPLAGLEAADFCAAYNLASCDFQRDSRAIELLREVADRAVLSATRKLGSKLIAVAAELVGATGPTGTDGFVPTDSQLFLEANYAQFRFTMGETPTSDSYWAVFFDYVDVGFNPFANYHSDANTGTAMRAAAYFVDQRFTWDYCDEFGPCNAGQGDCDPNRGQCDIDSACVNNIGADYNLPAGADVCVEGGHLDFCRDELCGVGEGDCDSHSECSGSARCLSNVGSNYGWGANVDVCEVRSSGSADYCSTEFPCQRNEGRCDSNAECAGSLRCVRFGFVAQVCL